jgi:hypothetical protein
MILTKKGMHNRTPLTNYQYSGEESLTGLRYDFFLYSCSFSPEHKNQKTLKKICS